MTIAGTQHQTSIVDSPFNHVYARLLDQFREESLDVSFRQMVGPLPSDDLTHGIFPYPARLLRQIPRMLLGTPQLLDGIDRIIDPFCGSGTVLLEAQRRGLASYGIEQNPIGALVSRVKTTPLDCDDFMRRSEAILRGAQRGRRRLDAHEFVRRWYDPSAYSALSRIAQAIATHGGATGDALAVALALTAKRTANTDPRIPVPVRPKEARHFGAADVWQTWRRETLQIARRVQRIRQFTAPATVTLGDARLPESWPTKAGSEGKSLVLTSPPYGAAQKYIRSTSLELGWLRLAGDRGTIELERNNIGREHLDSDASAATLSLGLHPSVQATITTAREASPARAAIYAAYFADMDLVFREASSHASRIVLVSGTNTVAGTDIATYDLLAVMLRGHGFTRTLSLKDEIRGRSLLTKRRFGAQPARAEFIEVFESEA